MSQSGKSTLFEAVTEGKGAAHAGGHHAGRAVVSVPDDRVEKLAQVYVPKKKTHATIEFLDLAGLDFTTEPGRHESRRVVAAARQAALLVLVARAFQDDSVMAYRDRIDPKRDLEELKEELLLADLEQVANRIEKLEKQINKPTPQAQLDKKELELMRRCHDALESLAPIKDAIQSLEEEKLVRSFGFLTLKPLVVVWNVIEDAVGTEAGVTETEAGGPVLVLSAKLEAELAALTEQERGAFMEELGVTEPAKDRLIRTCYQSMHLISFLTYGADEVRAWTIPAGCPAVEAAHEIHSDIARGFIRAETVAWDDYAAAGYDMKAVKAAGKARLEGKTYEVQDGDLITFRFNA